jgi:hypothetical protein
MITTCWQRNSPLGFDCASVATWRNAFISGEGEPAQRSLEASFLTREIEMPSRATPDAASFEARPVRISLSPNSSCVRRHRQFNCKNRPGKAVCSGKSNNLVTFKCFPARFAGLGLSQCQSQNTKLSPDALCNPALDCNRVVDWLVPVQRAPRRGRLQKQVGQHRFDIATIYCLHITRAAKIAVWFSTSNHRFW